VRGGREKGRKKSLAMSLCRNLEGRRGVGTKKKDEKEAPQPHHLIHLPQLGEKRGKKKKETACG